MQPEHEATAEASARELVERFWSHMASNDFASVAEVCSHDLIVEWPQSRERFVGVERFALMNHEYTAYGRWQFEVRRLVANEQQAVTEVAITDSVQKAVAISFFSIEAGLIKRIVEFWPEPFAAPASRAHLREAIDQGSV
jgi:hypothetical protein